MSDKAVWKAIGPGVVHSIGWYERESGAYVSIKFPGGVTEGEAWAEYERLWGLQHHCPNIGVTFK